MKRSLAVLVIAAVVYWAAIALFFGGFLTPAEQALFTAAWSAVSIVLAGALTFVFAVIYRLLEGRWSTYAHFALFAIWLPLAIWLTASLTSLRPVVVEYLGISNLSSCRDAVNMVMELDVEPADTQRDALTGTTWYVFEAESELGAEEVAVLCEDARLLGFSSTTTIARTAETNAESLFELDELHVMFLERLTEIHGETGITRIAAGFRSHWCFGERRDPAEARLDRLLLIDDETAELYLTSIRDGANGDYRIERGLSFASESC